MSSRDVGGWGRGKPSRPGPPGVSPVPQTTIPPPPTHTHLARGRGSKVRAEVGDPGLALGVPISSTT